MSSLIVTCVILNMQLVMSPVLLGLLIGAVCQPFCMFCSIHVASVVQMTHMLLCHGGVIKSGLLTRQAQLSTFWSACVHDFEHGGLNNDFLVKTSHPLAITYNDQSPLENHHHAAAVRLLLFDPSCRYLPVSLHPYCSKHSCCAHACRVSFHTVAAKLYMYSG